jgi:hypothetical protein
MARIRTIKPTYFTDAKLARELPRDARLFYPGLWTEADDAGRFHAHPRRLLGAIFPYDEDLTPGDVGHWLGILEETGRCILYEVDGELYGQLTRFDRHQSINRPTPSKLPAPPASLNAHGALSESSMLEEEEEEEEEKEVDLFSSSSQGVGARESDSFAHCAIETANRAMAANPAIGTARLRPIPADHTPSAKTVEAWAAAGITPDTALPVIEARGRAYRPDGRNAQITSLKYFDTAVREAHAGGSVQRSRNGTHGNHGAGKPAARRRRGSIVSE